MKDYKRLTEWSESHGLYITGIDGKKCRLLHATSYDRDYCLAKFAELEDKIESGELCDRKTCKNITDKNPVDEFVCSSCGFIIDDFSRVKVDDDGEVFHYEYEIKYCPNCGAKVEDEE